METTFRQERSVFNERLASQLRKRAELYRLEPRKLYPELLRSCQVSVLLVADNSLDFSDRDFGLSTFVSVLKDEVLSYVRFSITVAHLREGVSDDAVMKGEPGIANSIKGFRFDEPTHFTPTKYDQVWLFGKETNFHTGGGYTFRAANSATYPANRLSTQELKNLSEFMDKGGGLFATGDHGDLGSCLCGSVKRARSMRLWNHTSSNETFDEVSMGGPRRNDTNRIGHDAGSQFDDQSDDVPQIIQPRLYRSRMSRYLRAVYPHPLLCGPDGRIDVMPDHPHEGECIEPADLTKTYSFDNSVEYPPATGGGPRISPEIIATSFVPAGNNPPGKQATQAHSFGSICAYNGHRAGVGRVVTDATWHHFVNINLVGDVDYSDATVKGRGFLASPAGEAHFEKIKAYYVNIAVWISPPARHRCFHRRHIWRLLHQHRVIEAVVSNPDLKLDKVAPSIFFELGAHARDVLGHSASQCQTMLLVLDLIQPIIPELIPDIDPWHPFPDPDPDPIIPWLDPTPLLNIALGGALVSLHETFPFVSPDQIDEVDKRVDEVVERGVKLSAAQGLQSFKHSLDTYTKLTATITRRFK